MKRVFGSYKSEEEAIRTVEELQEKGYRAEDLLFLSNKNKREVLEESTEVEVKSSPLSNNTSLLDKIKQAFTQEAGTEDQTPTEEKLIEYGLSKEQALNYADDVESGAILIAADEESAGSTIRPLADPNLDPVPDPGVVEGDIYEPIERIQGTYGHWTEPSPSNPEPSKESIHPSEENRLYPEPEKP